MMLQIRAGPVARARSWWTFKHTLQVAGRLFAGGPRCASHAAGVPCWVWKQAQVHAADGGKPLGTRSCRCRDVLEMVGTPCSEIWVPHRIPGPPVRASAALACAWICCNCFCRTMLCFASCTVPL